MGTSKDSGWYSADLSKGELNELFAELIGDSQAAFGIEQDAALKSTAVFADLWAKGKRDILKQITGNILKHRQPGTIDGAELQQETLTHVAMEMAKLSLHFKNTKGKFSIMQSAAMFLFITQGMARLDLVHFGSPAGDFYDLNNLKEQARKLRADLDEQESKRAIEQQVLPGLSVKENEELKNYKAKQPGIFSGKTLLAVFVAAIVILLFTI